MAGKKKVTTTKATTTEAKSTNKYYTTKNQMIDQLQETIELLNYNHRKSVQDIEIQHQKDIDKKDDEISVLQAVVHEADALVDETMDRLHSLESRRFSECKNIDDLCNHLSPEDLRLLFIARRSSLVFGIRGEEENDYLVEQLDLAWYEDDRPDMPVIYTDCGMVWFVLERQRPCSNNSSADLLVDEN